VDYTISLGGDSKEVGGDALETLDEMPTTAAAETRRLFLFRNAFERQQK
jgi:hypothetical protein